MLYILDCIHVIIISIIYKKLYPIFRKGIFAMKAIFFSLTFSLLFFNIFIIKTATQASQPPFPPITLVVNNNSEVRTFANAATQTLQQSYDYYQTLQKLTDASKVHLWNYKYPIALALLGAGYSYLVYQIHHIHTAIFQNPHAWCNWKAVVSLQQLSYAQPQDLIEQLLLDIQKKYILSSITLQPNHQLPTMQQFLTDIAHELALLTWYQTTQKITTACWASKLFNFSYTETAVQEKIDRLDYILNIFIAWQTKELCK